MSLGIILTIASSAFDLFSSIKGSKEATDIGAQNVAAVQQTAQANAEISRYDASVAEEAAREAAFAYGVELKSHVEDVQKLIGSQKAAFAKSGVALGTGSALDVIADTARRGAEDAELIKYEGKKAVEYRRNLAERYRKLAAAGLRDAAIQSSIIMDTAKSSARSILYKGVGSVAGKIVDVGISEGWWD